METVATEASAEATDSTAGPEAAKPEAESNAVPAVEAAKEEQQAEPDAESGVPADVDGLRVVDEVNDEEEENDEDAGGDDATGSADKPSLDVKGALDAVRTLVDLLDVVQKTSLPESVVKKAAENKQSQEKATTSKSGKAKARAAKRAAAKKEVPVKEEGGEGTDEMDSAPTGKWLFGVPVHEGFGTCVIFSQHLSSSYHSREIHWFKVRTIIFEGSCEVA